MLRLLGISAVLWLTRTFTRLPGPACRVLALLLPGVLPLLRSGEPYFVASGLVIVAAMLAPVIPHALRKARRRLRGEARVEAQPWIGPAARADRAARPDLAIAELHWGALLDDLWGVVLCLQAGRETDEPGTEGQVLAVCVALRWRRRYGGIERLDELRVGQEQ